MKKNKNWIKMGFNVCKIAIICLVVLTTILWSRSNNKTVQVEKFSFNKSLGVKANVEQVPPVEEQPKEEPKPVKKEEKKETTKKETTKKPTVKKTTTKKTTATKKTTNTTPTVTNISTGTKLTGSLTGYGADCPKCGGTLACKSSYKVKNNGVVTYPDKTYGNVRIVASSKLLKCGSIVKFNLPKLSSKPIYAIVLDRGVLRNNLDILMTSEKEAGKKIGRQKITYEVIRVGW